MITEHQLPSYQDLNQTLLQSIYQLKQTDRGARKSAVGGWHSVDQNIVHLPGFDTLVEFLNQTVGEIDIIWAMVNGKGHYNSKHSHMPGYMSGVYYVKIPTPTARIIFYPDGQEVAIEPKEGLFLVFDGSLPHSVEENLSNEDRVCIAMNFKVSCKTVRLTCET